MTFKNIPKLKEHLSREKDAEASREKKPSQGNKRKSPGDEDAGDMGPKRGEPSSKRRAVAHDANT